MNKNPFIISGYLEPQYFCDRDQETLRIISAIENHRNLTIFSLRRMGKTGLIKHVFHKIESSKKILPIYIDIMPTANLSEFTEGFAKAVLSSLAKKENLLKKMLTSIATLRPTFTYDSVTGNPEISIKVGNHNEASHSLEIIFQYLAKQKQQIVIAIDEFQQISNYPEQNVEAELRMHMQQIMNTTFIFSGSRKHILSEIFSSPNRPFFNSTENMEIGRIDTDLYNDFIMKNFALHGKNISAEAIKMIEEVTIMHTFFVQYMCNRLFSDDNRNIGIDDVNKKYRSILTENEPIYSTYINLLTPFQLRLLRSIARNKDHLGITSKEFIARNNLGAASSIKTAIKSLLDKEFVYVENGRYFLLDRFFSGWLNYS